MFGCIVLVISITNRIYVIYSLLNKKEGFLLSQIAKESEELVLNTVRENNLISRADIARKTNLSKPIVSKIVLKFLEAGLVIEEKIGESSKRGGKKPILLSFVPGCRNLIGVDIGGKRIKAVLTDLNGEIKQSVELDSRSINSKKDLMLSLDQIIDKMKKLSEVEVIGIGISVPGTTDTQKGIVYYIPVFDIYNLHLKEIMEEKHEVPVVISNDVTSTAYGEMWKGSAKDCKNVFLVHIGTGTGSGLIIDGKNYTGAHNYAGEIGYMITDWENDKHFDQKKSFGYLENWMSGNAFERQAEKILGKKTSAKEFFSMIDKNPKLMDVFKTGCEHFALLMANIITLIDPEIIIISGGVGYNKYEMIKSTVEPILKKVLPGEMVDNTTFRKAELIGLGGAMGAIYLAQRDFFMNL